MAFEDEYGRIPTNEEGLNVLVEKPHHWKSDIEWTKVLRGNRIQENPWGGKYKYYADQRLETGYVIYTIGTKGLVHSLKPQENGFDNSVINLLPEQEQLHIRKYENGELTLPKDRRRFSLNIPGFLVICICILFIFKKLTSS